MRWSFRLLIVSALIFTVGFFSFGSAYGDSPTITDVSWPNCGAKLTKLTFLGIIGVNDGLDYSPNICLASETQLFHNSYSLYLNTGYPGASYGLEFRHSPKNCQAKNYLCLAYNFGYNDALYSIKYADEQGAHSSVWWLDVESENSWTSSYKQNREALIGMIDALETRLFMPTIGFYSYPGQWISITKDWHNYLPAWVATASSSINIANAYCTDSFNGGPVWITQYTTKLDYGYSCLPSAINDFKIR